MTRRRVMIGRIQKRDGEVVRRNTINAPAVTWQPLSEHNKTRESYGLPPLSEVVWILSGGHL